jgi:HSP20 family protein
MTEEKKEITVHEKREIQSKDEHTIPGIKYQPATDVVETETELLVYMDMAGVKKDKVKVKIEKGKLIVDGEIDSSPYSKCEPLYTEYNIGHYCRRFELSNEIDQSNIEAKMSDGVLLLKLPKVPEKQPKLIQVN